MTDVFFNFPVEYDSGTDASVGIGNGVVVEVHESNGPSSNLWCRVGGLTGDLVTFGDSANYDSGIHPAVAVNAGGTVVEVHETQSPVSSKMYYHVGQANGSNNTVSFGSSHSYDDGNQPDVALNDANVVVEVHESNGPSSNLWSRVGIVDTGKQTISFGDSQNYDVGSTPSVAVNNSNVVIEVHQSNGPSANLWYRVGTVDPSSKTLTFGDSHSYDTGANPSVALTDDGFVIEVHQSQAYSTLWKRIGTVDTASGTIQWIGDAVQSSPGTSPAVDTDGASAVMVCDAAQITDSLQVAASMVIDRASWMADHINLLGGKTLMEIAMPASHDAGMSVSDNCAWGALTCSTKTQTQSIGGQLEVGSRYFDIRPVLYDGEFYTGHYSMLAGQTAGCNGQSMADVLSDVVDYLASGRDLVILKFSHYLDRDSKTEGFTEAQMQELIGQVTTGLHLLMHRGDVPSEGLQSATVQDFIGGGGTVLTVFDDLPSSLHDPSAGIYTYADSGSAGDLVVYDSYADSNSLSEMEADQLGKLDDPSNHGANLFLLSWTLTQSDVQATTCATQVVDSILDLAQQADAAMWPALVSAYQEGKITASLMANLIYADNMQGTQADFAIWLNQQILG